MFLNAAELMRISLLQHLTETPFGWTFYLWTTKNRRQGNFGTFSNPFFWGWRRWTCQKYSIWISIWVLVPNPKVFKKFSFITCCFFWMVQLILGKFSIQDVQSPSRIWQSWNDPLSHRVMGVMVTNPQSAWTVRQIKRKRWTWRTRCI